MNITILCIGSRGDVQPYIALASGLASAGHTVQIASVEHFRPLVEGHGVAFRPIRGDVAAMLASPAARDVMNSGWNTARAVFNLVEMARPVLHEMADDCWDICRDSDTDLIITSLLGVFAVPIGMKLGIPVVQALAFPMHSPTRAFPSPIWPIPWRLGGWYNRQTYTLTGQVAWQAIRPFINPWMQRTLGLDPYSLTGPYTPRFMRHLSVLYAFSPRIVPPPPDWPATTHVTGYWPSGIPQGWQPPADLTAFLVEGPAPVYVGFGSMVSREPEATLHTVVRALEQAGQRGVILANGWAEHHAGELIGAGVMLVGSLPHEWLFPRMAALVHHGGAGTTGTGLAAGVPAVVVPFFGDQAFWGERLRGAGVSPPAIPHHRLNVESLAAAIRAATSDSRFRERAAALGEAIRVEDGVARAVEVIERIGTARKGLA
ncbi:MAG: glycosyltransferase family 1 protein [Anaerolineae bacterium]|nr:glycosyltransferase family 1 protein [Anaerolineae bacterium]